MRTRLTFAVAVVAALVAAGSALADNGPSPARGHGIPYAFVGQLTTVPANGALSLTVEGGNRPALEAMLGQSVAQTFTYGAGTEFLQWSKGIPTIVQPGSLAVPTEVSVPRNR